MKTIVTESNRHYKHEFVRTQQQTCDDNKNMYEHYLLLISSVKTVCGADTVQYEATSDSPVTNYN